MNYIYKKDARKDAFLILYQWDIKGDKIEEVIEDYITYNNIKNPERRRYARKLVRTYMEKAKEIDNLIAELTENWELDRLGYIERNILRVALTELLYIGVKRLKEAIADYIKLTVKYAGKNPAKFVNGILGKALRERLN